MTRGVLLVPSDDDPHGLLAEGLFGASPPIAIDWVCGGSHFDAKWHTIGEHHLGWGPLNPRPEHREARGWCHNAKGRRGSWDNPSGEASPGTVALILAWDGVASPEGLDRWWRCGKRVVQRWPFTHPVSWGVSMIELVNLRDDPRAALGGAFVLVEGK